MDKEIECEQCTYLQGQEVDSLQTEFSDTPQWLQSNGSHTHAKFLENEPQMDGFQVCECGRGMSDCSIHPNTPEKWIASMQDSLVRILARLENRQGSAKEPVVDFTEKSCVLLAQLDPDSSSWKMSPLLKATDLKRYSKTWSAWGMTQGGYVYAHQMSGHRITATGGFYWLTPTSMEMATAGDGEAYLTATGTVRRKNKNGTSSALGLSHQVRYWPTPNASDCRDRGNMSNPSIQCRAQIGKQLNLSMVVHPTSGQLNPQWVEWLMGWPIGHTASKHLEMVKYHSKSQLHLPSWLKA